MSHIKIIEKNGKPFALVPHKDWLRIREDLEDALDALAYERGMAAFKASGYRTYPLEVVDRFIDGENHVKVIREWRKLTQAQLAAKTGLSKVVISHIETGVRNGGMKTLGKIAAALNVPIEILRSTKK